MDIRWQGFHTNNHALLEAGMDSTEALLIIRQLRWVGDLSRMEDRMPKAIFYGEIKVGRHNRCVLPPPTHTHTSNRNKDTLLA